MSGIEHRQRVRERQTAGGVDLSSFIPQNNTKHLPPEVVNMLADPPGTGSEMLGDQEVTGDLAEAIAAATPDSEAAGISTDAEQRGDDVVDTPQAATPAVVPHDETPAMTPQEMQAHARQLAEQFASLPEEDYSQALSSLQASQPNMYAMVVDVLTDMAASQESTTNESQEGASTPPSEGS